MVATNTAVPGIVEDVMEAGIILDKIILKIDESDEQRSADENKLRREK